MELCDQLEELTVNKQYLKLMRMKDIIRAATNLREKQEMKRFYDMSISSLIAMHPHASK